MPRSSSPAPHRGWARRQPRSWSTSGHDVTAIDIKPTEVAVDRFARGRPPRPRRHRRRGRIDRRTGQRPLQLRRAARARPSPSSTRCWSTSSAPATSREGLVPKMPSGSSITAISSSAAVGWQDQMATIGQLLATDGFDEAVDVADGPRGVVVLERLPVLEVGRRCLGRLVVPRPRRARHPDQLHQPRSHRHGDDAGVPRLRHQGGGRPGGRADRALRASRRAGVAARDARQPAPELRRRRGARRRRRVPGCACTPAASRPPGRT